MFFQVTGDTMLKDIKKPVSYVFIVVRNNVVENVRVFKDANEAVPFTDNFIMDIDKSVRWDNLPRYSNNEVYSKDGLTIGLYIIP